MLNPRCYFCGKRCRRVLIIDGKALAICGVHRKKLFRALKPKQ